MNNFNKQLSESARDFKNLVWPIIVKNGWLKGHLEPVELQSTRKWTEQLDILAGIDAWLVKPQGLAGLASRVQKRPSYFDNKYPYNTINIRVKRTSGGLTELNKRTYAITSGGELIYPYWTCHAYLEAPSIGPVLSIGLIRTQELIEAIALGYGYEKQNREDGTIFHCVPFALLDELGYNILTHPPLNQLSFKLRPQKPNTNEQTGNPSNK